MINTLKNTLLSQLSIDAGTEEQTFLTQKNSFVTLEASNDMQYGRTYDGIIICYNNHLLCRTDNEELTNYLEKTYQQANGAWFSQIGNLIQLSKKLKNFGYTITNHAPYFVPKALKPVEKNIKLKLYSQADIHRDKNFEPFEEVFLFDKDFPDMIGLAYLENQQIKGLIGANRCSSNFWEIGIQLLPELMQQGIATMLLEQLTARIIEEHQGMILPIYSTQLSHNQSINVAIRAGYQHGWTQLTLKKEETT